MILARRLISLVVFVALLVGGWYFAANNSESVVVRYPGGVSGEFRMWVALAGTFGVGVVLTALIAIYRGARMRLVMRRYRKMLDDLQAEIHQLRNLPLEDSPAAGGSAAPERGS
ncbi:MAG: LapA family protein [Myxococcota bacterium]